RRIVQSKRLLERTACGCSSLTTNQVGGAARPAFPMAVLCLITRRACAQKKIYPLLEFALPSRPPIRRLLRSNLHAPKPIAANFFGEGIYPLSNLNRPCHPAIAHRLTSRLRIERDARQGATQRNIGRLGCSLKCLNKDGHGWLADTL